MPTGTALRDVRDQLFDAAERILLRDGPAALTSRAVTTEAGCAKGVLHRHFTDFDDFLTELVLDRSRRFASHLSALPDTAGTRTVTAVTTEVIASLFASIAPGVVALYITRDELRHRLRAHNPAGIPLLTDATEALRRYLAAEQALGRIAPEADTDTLALTLIGTSHLMFAGRPTRPGPDEIHDLVASILAR